MLIADNAPSFRTAGGMVEVPHDWRDARYWPTGKGVPRVDDQAVEEIDRLIRDVGRETTIYADGLAEMVDNHRATKHGYTVPITQWDAAMRELCGVWWDAEHEREILSRARTLGWRPPEGYVSPHGWSAAEHPDDKGAPDNALEQLIEGYRRQNRKTTPPPPSPSAP